MKKGLCQFLNSFSAKLFLLLFGLVFFTFFGGSDSVSAATTLNTYNQSVSGNQVNNINVDWVGTCENSFVFLTFQHYKTRTVSSITYDGQAMTLYSTGNGAGNSFVDVYYLPTGSASGTKQVSITQNAADWSGIALTGFCNVDPTNPIDDYYVNTGSAGTNPTNSDVDINYNGSWVVSWLSYYGGTTWNSNLSSINTPWANQVWALSSSSTAAWLRNYIGGAVKNSAQNQTISWTSSASNIGWGYVVLKPYDLSPSTVAMSFQPQYNFNINFSAQVGFSYDPTIFHEPEDYIDIQTCAGSNYDTPDCNNLTTVGTSTIMSPLDISLDVASGQGFFISSSTVPITKTYKITPHVAATPTLHFDPLYTRISFVDNLAQQIADIQPYFGTSTIASTTFGIDIRGLACSEDDWADTNWWTQIRCQTVYTALKISTGFVSWLNTAISSVGQQLISIFPFNLANNIRICWYNSADQNMPATLSWLDIADSNGNIYAQFPHEWTGAATDTPMLMFGPGIFAANSAMANFFTGIRALSTYFVWIIFIWSVINKGKNILEDINQGKQNEE